MSRLHEALDASPLAETHPARRLLAAKMGRRGDVFQGSSEPPSDHWSPEYFGLQRVRLFREAREESRQAVLQRCGGALLQEAYFIEKAGVHFGAKMVLCAESTTERQLYACIAAEEAAHLDAVGRYVRPQSEADWQRDPFLQLLAQAIDEGSRGALQVIVQVVLEGWGLRHYRDLSRACRTPQLRSTLQSIVADEAGHHGSGLSFLSERELSAADEEFLNEVLSRLLGLVAAGPQGIVAALGEELGDLGRGQRREIFEELSAREHAGQRLQILRGLLCKAPCAARVTHTLDRRGCFEAPPIEEML